MNLFTILNHCRTPNLEHLVVLPNLPWITQKGLVTALRLWPKMESISISFYNSNSPLEVIFQNLGEYCMNLSALKCHVQVFSKTVALAIVNFLPGK